jgi:hypothetical protein
MYNQFFPDVLSAKVILVRSNDGHALVGLDLGFEYRIHENILKSKKSMGVSISNRRDEVCLENILDSMRECNSFHRSTK